MKGKLKKYIAFLIVFAMFFSANMGAYASMIEDGAQVDELEGPGDLRPLVGDITGVQNQEGVTTDPIEIEYVINYLEKDTDKNLADQKSVTGQTLGAEVTEEAIDIEGYNKVEPMSATIILAESGNVITFYYTAIPVDVETDISHIVTYVAGGNGSIIGETEQTVGEGLNTTEVTATPLDGYVFASWSDGNTNASRYEEYVTADATYTATFEEVKSTFRYIINYLYIDIDGEQKLLEIENNPFIGNAPVGFKSLPEHPIVEGFSVLEDQPIEIEVTEDGLAEVDVFYEEIILANRALASNYPVTSEVLETRLDSSNDKTDVQLIWTNGNQLFLGILGDQKPIQSISYEGQVVNLATHDVYDTGVDIVVGGTPRKYRVNSNGADNPHWIVVSFSLDNLTLKDPFKIYISTGSPGYDVKNAMVDIVNGYIIYYYIDGTQNKVPGIAPNPVLGYATPGTTININPPSASQGYIVKPGQDLTFTPTTNNSTKIINYILGTASYKVEHYKQKSDGSYPLIASELESKTGTTGSTVTATPKTYTGYTFDNTVTGTVESGIVLANGSLVLKLYYTADPYNVNYDGNTGTGTMTDSANPYIYDEEVTVLANKFTKTGYHFTGWNTSADGTGTAYSAGATFNMPANDVTLYAQWAANVDTAYKVEHYKQKSDGSYPLIASELESKTGTTGSTVTATPKTYTGYTFDNTVTGTVESGIIATDGSLVLELYYTANPYNINYDGNTGTGTMTDSANPYIYDEEVTVLANKFTKTGYHFTGWNTSADGTGTAYSAGATFNMPANDVTLYAQWAANVDTAYKVEHYKQKSDGSYPLIASELESKTGTTGSTVTATPKTYTGYTFDNTVTGTVESGIIATDGSLVLKLYYTADPYNVNYDGNTGTGTMTDSANPYIYDEEVTVLANKFTKTGYHFTGWNTSADGTGTAYSAGATFNMPANDVTLYAQWAANVDTAYKVEHYKQKSDGSYPLIASELESKTGTTGSTVTATPKTYTGYTFDNTVTGTVESGIIATDGSLVLKLYYTADPYNVNYDGNTGTGTMTDSANPYIYDEEVTVLANKFTKTGYHFTGWNTSADGTGTAYSAGATFNMPANDVTLYAQWAANVDTAYKVEHYKQKSDGSYPLIASELESKTGTTGSTVTATPKTYTGYTFDNTVTGTVESGIIATDGSLVLELYYTANPYNINYDGNTGTGTMTDSANPYIYDEEVTVLANEFTKTGYHFTGWNTSADGTGTAYSAGATFNMPANDVTLYAQWAANVDTAYKVEHYKQKSDGSYPLIASELESKTGTTGSTVTATPKTYTGYTFDNTVTGTVESGIIATDGSLVLELYYTANPYNINYDGNTGTGTMTDSANPYIYDEEVTVLANEFTKTGYHFTGWNTSADGTGTAYSAGATFNMPANDVTLYAQWAANVDTAYKVEHYKQKSDGSYPLIASELESKTGTTGSTVTATPKTYTGYTFDNTVTGTVESGIIATDGSLVLKLYYTADPYNVNYDGNTGTGTMTDSANPYIYDEEVTVLANKFTKTGYHFTGWNTSADGTGTAYSAGATFNMPANDVTLYAQWAGLEIVKTGTYIDSNENDKVDVGDKINYTITVTNTGEVDLTNVIVTDSMLGGVLENPGTELLPGATWTYEGSYEITQADIDEGSVINKVTVDTDETDQEEEEETTELEQSPGLTISKVANKSKYDSVGEKITYIITVKNTGNITLTGIKVSDPLITLVGPSGDTNSNRKLDVDEEWKYTGIYEITQADMNNGSVRNVATVATDQLDPLTDSETIGKNSAQYTVRYLEEGTNRVLSPQKTGNGIIGEVITESAITISGYRALAPTTVTITLKATGNVITFYYTERGGSGGGGGGDDDDEEIIDEPVPEAQPELNKEDHFQYIQGYPDNSVRPEGLITREEVAAVFYRLLTSGYRNSIWTITHNFPDVDSNRWSTKHIATLANGGIITGYPDGNFRPGNFITRAELATIASRFDNLSPFESDSFTDITGHWANKYINSATQKGWVNGYPDRTFKPNQYITRAEFVTLVNAVLERRVHKEDILEDARKFPDLLESKWYYEQMQESINSHYYNRLEDTYEEWTEIYYPNLDM